MRSNDAALLVVSALALAGPRVARGDVTLFDPRADVVLTLTAAAPVTPAEADGARAELERFLESHDVAIARLLNVSTKAGVLECDEGSFLCWTRKIPLDPGGPPRIVLMLGYQDSGKGRRLVGVALDLKVAKSIIADDSARGVTDEVLDTRIFSRAATSIEVEGASGEGLLRVLRPWLLDRGAMGTIRLIGIPAGAAVLVDDRALILRPDDVHDLRSVPEGEHRVTVRSEGKESKRGVTVRAGEIAELRDLVSVEVPPAPIAVVASAPPPTPVFRRINLFGGGALVILGVAAIAASPAFVDSDPDYTLCFPGCAPERSTFAGTGPRDHGVLMVPLGYSLGIAGASMMLGDLAASDETSWVPFVAGLALGAIAYGISAAAN